MVRPEIEQPLPSPTPRPPNSFRPYTLHSESVLISRGSDYLHPDFLCLMTLSSVCAWTILRIIFSLCP